MPPRPQLSYTVSQRAALTEGLIHDRENARYTDQVVRYRAGLSDEPPPPAPPPPPVPRPAPGAQPPPSPTDGDDPALSLQAPPTVSDDGGLDDFIRGLVRDTEGRTAPAQSPPPPVAPAGEAEGEPQAGATPPPTVEGAGAIVTMVAAAAPPRATAPRPLFPAAAEAPRPGPLARLAAWLGGWFRAPPGGAVPEAAVARSDRHPALVPVAVTGPEELGPARVATAVGRMPPKPAAADRADGSGAALTLAGAMRPAPGPLGPSVGAGLIDLGDAAGFGAVRPPPGVALGVVGFAPESAALPHDVEAVLRRAAALAGADPGSRRRLHVVGYDADPALAAERAAAVGFALVGLGVAAGDLRLAVESAGGSPDEARVFLAAGGVR